MAYKRNKMSRKGSRKNFKKNAMRVHPKNAGSVGGNIGPMRGGIRL